MLARATGPVPHFRQQWTWDRKLTLLTFDTTWRQLQAIHRAQYWITVLVQRHSTSKGHYCEVASFSLNGILTFITERKLQDELNSSWECQQEPRPITGSYNSGKDPAITCWYYPHLTLCLHAEINLQHTWRFGRSISWKMQEKYIWLKTTLKYQMKSTLFWEVGHISQCIFPLGN